jgi:anti-sigma regulatory factor (Ser/Thr protein kinase)
VRDARFRHVALFYEGEEQYLQGTLPFLEEGLRGGDAILVAIRGERRELLRAALGADAGAVSFVNMHELGRNPARIIPAWFQFLASCNGQAARGIGEPVWPGRSDAELVECDRHESLLNLAFAGRGWQLLCPYDLDGLDAQLIEAARRSHPFLHYGGLDRESSPHAQQQRAQDWTLSGPLPAPTAAVAEHRFSSAELAGLRAAVASWARESLGDERTQRLVLAASELASNSVRHGGGGGVLRMWREDYLLSCEVSDAGRIRDPLVGRLPPTTEQRSGWGLWLVSQLCDLLQVRSSDAGTVVRAHMRLS